MSVLGPLLPSMLDTEFTPQNVDSRDVLDQASAEAKCRVAYTAAVGGGTPSTLLIDEVTFRFLGCV